MILIEKIGPTTSPLHLKLISIRIMIAGILNKLTGPLANALSTAAPIASEKRTVATTTMVVPLLRTG